MAATKLTIQIEPGALSIPEFCAWARISRAWVYLLMERGELRTVKRGRRRLVPMEAAREWLNGQ